MSDPWQRQPCDTDESWAAFISYRDAGPGRRLQRVAVRNVRVPAVQVTGWYTSCNWRERVAAWDEHLDAIAREERETVVGEEAREAAARHKQMLRDCYELADRELQKYLETSRENDAPGLVKVSDLNKLVENVVKLDRLVRGETTERTAMDFGKLTTEELRDLERKLKGK